MQLFLLPPGHGGFDKAQVVKHFQQAIRIEPFRSVDVATQSLLFCWKRGTKGGCCI